jgi:vacuolar-type H+-ATPase subunit E/Vma4
MAKKKKGLNVVGYIEKASSQLFDRYQKEATDMIKGYIKSSRKMLPVLKKRVQSKIREELKKSFRVMPSSNIKKMLPRLKKQVKNKIKEELEKSFRVMPSDNITKMLPTLKKQLKNRLKEELEKSFRIIPSGGTKKSKRRSRPKQKK